RVGERLGHRGPDGRGTYIKGKIALLHVRLAIVDVAGGAQPIANEDGTVQVICNGEVYDQADLRAELEAKGHSYRTRSDTEAIVHGYEAGGEGVSGRLRGMFAFAVWDGTKKRLLLGRDRLGIKPLYYALLPGGDLVFASEMGALLAWPDLSAEVDPH